MTVSTALPQHSAEWAYGLGCEERDSRSQGCMAHSCPFTEDEYRRAWNAGVVGDDLRITGTITTIEGW